MILASHGIIASQIASFDADAVAFFNRVTTAGGTLSTTEKQAVNQLVLDLKANSLWTPMKAIYPMVGASAAACAQNLKSSSFTGTFSSGWTFASTGVTPNGTSAYMNTGLAPSGNLSLNSTHLSYYSRTNISAGQVEIGLTDTAATSHCYLIYSFSGTGFSALNSTEGARTSAANPTTGFLIGSRISSLEEKYYTNNVSQTRTAASTSLSTRVIYSGAYNQNGSANFFSTKQCAFASIGDGLDATQASNFYTAVQAFQTTLSRQV